MRVPPLAFAAATAALLVAWLAAAPPVGRGVRHPPPAVRVSVPPAARWSRAPAVVWPLRFAGLRRLEEPGEPGYPALAARVESYYRAAPEDAARAREVERRVDAEVRACLPEGSYLRSLTCRGALCRLETEHADPEAWEEFVAAAFGQGGIGAHGAFLATPEYTRSEGGLVVVAYLAEEGAELVVGELGDTP